MSKAANSSGVSEAHGVEYGRVDGHVWELNDGFIPLTMNDHLIAMNNVKVGLHHIHVLICVMTHGKDPPEHLQEPGVGARGEGCTTAAGSASRSHIWRRRSATTTWTLQNCRAKRLMCYILIEPLMGHCLNHAHDIQSKSTRSLRVDDNVPYLINNVVKHIEALKLHECIK
jgi:hypothetical protein